MEANTSSATSQRASWARRLIHYGLAIGILFGLWYFDRLRLDDFVQSGIDWRWMAPVLALFLPAYLMAALRLQSLLRGMNAHCSFLHALSMTFYGALGELVIPVFIGGDVVKAIYVGRSTNRSTAVASVLADRLVGLLGLCVFALLTAVLQIELVLQDQKLQQTVLLLAAFSGCCLLACLTLVCLHNQARWLLTRCLMGLPAGEKLLAVCRLFGHLCGRPHWWISLFLSVLGHALWAVTVILLAYALKIDCPFVPALLILPIVAFCNTASFAGGIGGGVVAMEYLFSHVLGAAPGDGCKLGIALPIVINLSKAYALPWFFCHRHVLPRFQGSQKLINVVASKKDEASLPAG